VNLPPGCYIIAKYLSICVKLPLLEDKQSSKFGEFYKNYFYDIFGLIFTFFLSLELDKFHVLSLFINNFSCYK